MAEMPPALFLFGADEAVEAGTPKRFLHIVYDEMPETICEVVAGSIDDLPGTAAIGKLLPRSQHEFEGIGEVETFLFQSSLAHAAFSRSQTHNRFAF